MQYKKNILVKYIPGVAWFFLVLYFISMSPANIPPVESWINQFYPDKWVHFFLFGTLAFLFIYPIFKSDYSTYNKKNSSVKIVLATIVWGLATEFIQKYFIVGRFFDWWDWLADSLGAILAYILALKLFKP